MGTFWVGIVFQIISAAIGGGLIADSLRPYAPFSGVHLALSLVAAGLMITGITLMLKGLREYFLGDITDLLRKMAENK